MTCQGAAAKDWLEEWAAELLPVPYFHVVYTLPGQIADLAYTNKAIIYDILFKASAEATLTIAEDSKRCGAKIGITLVLHTWGSTMTHHPHVHMIVPGGGHLIAPVAGGQPKAHQETWIACRPIPSSRRTFPNPVISAIRRCSSGHVRAAAAAC
jgi:hypothetical protein